VHAEQGRLTEDGAAAPSPTPAAARSPDVQPDGAARLARRGARALRGCATAALIALAAMLPFELEAPLGHVGPLQLSSVEVFLYVALGTWAAARVVASIGAAPPRRLAWVLPSRAHLALGALALVFLVSALAAPVGRASALKFALRSLGGMALFWAVADLLRPPPSRSDGLPLAPGIGGEARGAGLGPLLHVAVALMIGSGAAGLLMIAELYVPGAAERLRPFHAQTFQTFGLLRASGPFQYPNIAAMYLEAVLPVVLAAGVAGLTAAPRGEEGAATRRRRRARVALTTAAGAAIFYALLLASSRAGITTAFALLLGLAVAAGRRTPLRHATAATLGLGLFLLGMTFTATDPLAGLRLQVWQSRPWYRSVIVPDPRQAAPLPAVLAPGSVAVEPIEVRNDGAIVWPHRGAHAVYLGYHWKEAATGQTAIFEGVRTPLPEDVPPGGAVTVAATIVAPPGSGRYVLRWDLVQEDVTWFSLYGDRSVSQQVEVRPLSDAEHATRAGAVVAAAPTMVRDPAQASGSDAGGVPRRQLWTAAWRAWCEHPLLGLGPDNFRHTYGRYLGLTDPDDRLHANNFYLEVLATLGLAGVVAFAAVAVALGRLARGALAAAPGAARVMALGATAGLAAFAVHGTLDYFLEFTPTYALLWLLAGMLAAAAPGDHSRASGPGSGARKVRA